MNWITLKALFSVIIWNIFKCGTCHRLKRSSTEEEEIIEMEAWSARLVIPPSEDSRILVLKIGEEFKQE